MIILSIFVGVFCSIVLDFLIIYFIRSLAFPIQQLLNLVLILIGPFISGLISKKHGMLVGAITGILILAFYSFTILWLLKISFPPEATQSLPVHYGGRLNAFLLFYGGLLVFLSLFAGLLGERVRRKYKSK